MYNKVAIITLYYGNSNYGANLQSYALCKKINDLGYDAEQISYDLTYTRKPTLYSRLKHLARYMLVNLNPKCFARTLKNKKIKRSFNERTRKTHDFRNDYIPHTSKIYNKNNVVECVDNYGTFIAGSDQVWNFRWYYPAYFLSFVPESKAKFSYAASLSMTQLSCEQAQILKDHLKDYKAVSVREQDAVDLLNGLSPIQAQWVLDPTMLLNKQEWDAICAEEILHEPYVYCHFLGDDEQPRKLACEFAKKNNLKVVTVPHLDYKYRKCDENFGDIKLYDIGPREFVSLIKNSAYVFTDSFHAMVFSGIYEKQYFVFRREAYPQMSSRIYSLCDLYETTERFCNSDEKCSLSYIEGLSDIDYTKTLDKFLKMKEKSIKYLEENLKTDEER